MSQSPQFPQQPLDNPQAINNKAEPDAFQVQNFHTNADYDGSPKSIHHTLGPYANQASPGNHTHDGGASSLLALYVTSSQLANYAPIPGAWVNMATAGYSSGWVDYGAPFRAGRYRKVGTDEVEVEGVVKHATLTQLGAIFVLPVGFRPASQVLFLGQANAGLARLDIYTDGTIYLTAYMNSGQANYIGLSAIRFATS